MGPRGRLCNPRIDSHDLAARLNCILTALPLHPLRTRLPFVAGGTRPVLLKLRQMAEATTRNTGIK